MRSGLCLCRLFTITIFDQLQAYKYLVVVVMTESLSLPLWILGRAVQFWDQSGPVCRPQTRQSWCPQLHPLGHAAPNHCSTDLQIMNSNENLMSATKDTWFDHNHVTNKAWSRSWWTTDHRITLPGRPVTRPPSLTTTPRLVSKGTSVSIGTLLYPILLNTCNRQIHSL